MQAGQAVGTVTGAVIVVEALVAIGALVVTKMLVDVEAFVIVKPLVFGEAIVSVAVEAFIVASAAPISGTIVIVEALIDAEVVVIFVVAQHFVVTLIVVNRALTAGGAAIELGNVASEGEATGAESPFYDSTLCSGFGVRPVGCLKPVLSPPVRTGARAASSDGDYLSCGCFKPLSAAA